MQRTVQLLTLAVIAKASQAQPVIDFVTVGAPGNRATVPSEVPDWPGMQVGSVNYEYRISQTEVLVEDWYPFVQAYAPFWNGSVADSRFTSIFIYHDGDQYVMAPGTERYPIDTTWHMAARYVNWLHNGAISGQEWAFETGVYETSTFTQNPDGSWNDQVSHSPNARFWIPTYDETFKAFYYDPDRYGSGEGGYWLYPNSSNVSPVSGPPGVGTTNAGLGTFSQYSVAGQYPDYATPWGVLDASGGENELSETTRSEHFRDRYEFGTSLGTSANFIRFIDRTDWQRPGAGPDGSLVGFRIAASIPQPGGVVLLGAVVTAWGAHRRRK
ncbi:hypothetical protein PHYC_02858 [Phycisphaerales bacterium]|nr:hypothetical protein PHYC_02858 [Phycisphaerales bacterium]